MEEKDYATADLSGKYLSLSLSLASLACSLAGLLDCSLVRIFACALMRLFACLHICSRSLWLSPACFARSARLCSRSLSLRYLACAFACSIAHARLLDCLIVRLCACCSLSLTLVLAHLLRSLVSLAACLFSLALASLSRLRICLFALLNHSHCFMFQQLLQHRFKIFKIFLARTAATTTAATATTRTTTTTTTSSNKPRREADDSR